MGFFVRFWTAHTKLENQEITKHEQKHKKIAIACITRLLDLKIMIMDGAGANNEQTTSFKG